MGADALLVVPPFLKYVAGPLLGPAMLQGAAEARGHRVDVLDLNIAYLREAAPGPIAGGGEFVGDHDRPERLREIEARFAGRLRSFFPLDEAGDLGVDPVLALAFPLDAVERAVLRLVESEDGRWIEHALGAPGRRRPDLVGVSVLWSGQVLYGLAVSMLARRAWPGVPVVWGGAHVTALAAEIVRSPSYGTWIDGFVFGYAEDTFAAVLDAVASGGPLPPECNRAGGGVEHRGRQDVSASPVFANLDVYGVAHDGTRRIAIPAQASRGCPYGRCAYCTYPAIEGEYGELPWDVISRVIAEADRLGATLSFKDSLILPDRLAEIATLVDGRVPWSACTKLHPRLADGAFLRRLRDAGLRTLEVGAETFDGERQKEIEKEQSLELFARVCRAVEAAGVSLVVNLIAGFPGEDPRARAASLGAVRAIIGSGERPVKLHESRFQLERLSKMGRSPDRYGMRVVRAWPWASVLAWAEEKRFAGRRLVVV